MRARVIQVGGGLTGEALHDAVACLREGELVVVPTETVYGVAADPRAPGAVEKLAALKGRDRDKPIALLATGIDAVVAFGAVVDDTARRLARRYWPGSLTLVLDVAGGAEGFRVPDHPVALSLLAETGVLRVTSANLSGAPPALTAGQALNALGERVALVLDAGPVRTGVASTVVKAKRAGLEILREGPIPADEILRVAGLESAERLIRD